MGQLILYALLLGTGAVALARPWIGILAYYLFAILGPQYIWWWNFEGLRTSLIIALCTTAGVGFQYLKNSYDSLFIFNRQNLWVFGLWFFVTCSYFFGPYVEQYVSATRTPGQLFYASNVVFVFYFLSLMEMNDLKKNHFLIMVFVFSTVYLAYWANNQYFTANWNQFNMGRLMGPFALSGGSIYKDENAFAMLFVTGLPFVYYFGWILKNKWLRYGLWLFIPLGWHAIFLTGSRGGLVGLGVVMLLLLVFSNRKILVVPMLLAFLFFYQWQAGDTMKSRSDTIASYEEESSAQMRIAAWTGGLRMLLDHPITGVGLGTFATALPDYYETNPRVAHNTLIQFAGESGVGAGVAYLAILWGFYKNFRRLRQWCRDYPDLPDLERIDLYNKASTASFGGLVVCSMFLSLNTYEIFFVLLILNNSLTQICRCAVAQVELQKNQPRTVELV